jgi:hypothetical protein
MEPKALEQYRATVNEIRRIFAYDIELRKVFGNRVGRVKDAFQVMVCQMDALAEDKEVEVSPEQKATVEKAVNDFLAVAIYQPMLNLFRDLSKQYLKLAVNWNRELGKVQAIDVQAQASIQIVEGQETFVAAARTLRQLIKHVESMEKFAPPAFQLSKHFLDSIRQGKGK